MSGEKVWTPLAATIPRPHLRLDAQLRPTTHVRFSRSEGGSTELDLGTRVVKSAPGEAAPITALLEVLDGRTLGDAIKRCEGSEEVSLAIARELFEIGALRDVAGVSAPALSFHDHIVSIGRARHAEMARRSCLLGVDDAPPHRRLLLGILVQTYHYVESAASHIGAAVCAAPTQRLRLMFSEFLAEEYGHGNWLKDGLVAGGIARDDIDRSQPLPAQLSVIGYLRWLAATEVLSYSACVGVTESPTDDPGLRDKIIAQWAQLAELGCVSEDVLAPFRDHELLDLEAEHGALSAEPFADHDWLSQAQQERIRRAVATLISCQESAYQATKHFYADPSGGSPLYFVEDL